MSDTSAQPSNEFQQGADSIDALEAAWSAIEPLGIDAQEDFLKGVLDRVSVVSESDRDSLDKFLVEKWDLWEAGFYEWAEAKDRQHHDRITVLEAEWMTQENYADRQTFLKQILQHAVDEEGMKVANQFVKPKDSDLWRIWAEPLEEWESARAERERVEDSLRNRGRYIG